MARRKLYMLLIQQNRIASVPCIQQINTRWCSSLPEETFTVDISDLKSPYKHRINGRPLPKPDPATADPEELKAWTSEKCSLYGRYGEASGVDPAELWPSNEFRELEFAKLEFQEPLDERIRLMKEKNAAEDAELEAHQRKIVERMQKMDELIAQYKGRRSKRVVQDLEQLKQREEMLEEAREFFGYEVTENDSKFQQLMEWKELEARQKKKKTRKLKEKDLLAFQVASLVAEESGEGGDETPQ